MKPNIPCFLRRVHKDERGQMLVMVAVMLVAILALTAFVIDMGHVYFCYRELQATTDAAALAGGAAIPNGTAFTTAYKYSGSTANGAVYNVHSNLTIPTVTPQLGCATNAAYQLPPCIIYGAQISANVLQVTEKATVPLMFASLVGRSSMPITAVSVASASGGSVAPFNVAIVVDSTASMGSQDAGGLCPHAKETCALDGVQVLLQNLSPCAGTGTCTASGKTGQVNNAVDEVSLFTFPAITSASAPSEYCGGGRPSVQPYPLPAIGVAPASTPTYQVVGFSSDYRSSSSSTTLNSSSDLTLAAGGASTCTGLQDPGGAGTYYPSVIYSAESLLLSEQEARPNTQNALIILGDGEATATKSDMASNATASGTYPSYNDECTQAVTAAQWAANQGVGGTRVYVVAYGTSNSTGAWCQTDPAPYNVPCNELKAMASTAAYFYTDVNSTKSGCTSTDNQTITSLNQIFTNITGSLTVARLLPPSLFP